MADNPWRSFEQDRPKESDGPIDVLVKVHRLNRLQRIVGCHFIPRVHHWGVYIIRSDEMRDLEMPSDNHGAIEWWMPSPPIPVEG